MLSISKLAKILIPTLLLVSAMVASSIRPAISVQIGLTIATDKSAYYLREKMTVYGTATFEGTPVTDALVSLEIRNPKAQAIAYRTLTIGNPTETWALNITDISIWNMSYIGINTAKVGTTILISTTIANPMLNPREYVTVTISLYDGNMIPLQALVVYEGRIDAKTSVTAYGTFHIPKWAYSGKATVYANAYDGMPADGGIPYLPEKSTQFYISRTQEGLFEYSSTAGTYTLFQTFDTASQTSEGTYSSILTLPPTNSTTTPEAGTYSVYTTIRLNLGIAIYKTTNSTTFNVLSQPGTPPTASFVWFPLQPYPNETVTFDASSSSAEGFDDFITRYEWDFGDGTPIVVKGKDEPTVTHEFMETRQYIITLNVTDNEGLWSLTQKPLTTKPTNPTAAFTWTPETPRIGTTVTFNASTSKPGWSIKTASPAPIASYVWNFGDGTGNFTLPAPNSVLGHTYDTPGDFPVLLEVIDTENQRDSIIHIVQVQNATSPPWDINGDGKCDIKDIAIVAKAYGSEPGDPNWNPEADITGPTPGVPDGVVDIRDVALVAKHYGETY